MPNFQGVTDLRVDTQYLAREAGYSAPDELLMTGLSPGSGPMYEDSLRVAFNFLRRHDDGRYSSRMKMRVLNAAEKAESARMTGAVLTDFPGVIVLELPFAYDEDTEVKTGGVLGVAVVWPNDESRMMLAVHGEHRREGVGHFLVSLLRYPVNCYGLTAWVASHNTTAQHFLLEQGFRPSDINRSGGVRYEWGEFEIASTVDGTEDGIDPLTLPQNRDVPHPGTADAVFAVQPRRGPRNRGRTVAEILESPNQTEPSPGQVRGSDILAMSRDRQAIMVDGIRYTINEWDRLDGDPADEEETP